MTQLVLSKEQDSLLTGEVKDILLMIGAIEEDLENFYQGIAPLLSSLGWNLLQGGAVVGLSFYQASEQKFAQTVNRIAVNGYVSEQDIIDLERAQKMRERGKKIAATATVVGLGLQAISWLWGKYKETQAKKKIIELVSEKKSKQVEIYSFIEKNFERIAQLLEFQDKWFRGMQKVVVSQSTERITLWQQMEKAFEGYRKLIEAQMRLQYYKQVYTEIFLFDENSFEESLQRIVNIIRSDKTPYLIKGAEKYIERVDNMFKDIKWRSPFYENGLPEIVVYALRNPHIVFLGEEYSSQFKKIVRRIQKESISAVLSPSHFKALLKYTVKHTKSFIQVYHYYLLALSIIVGGVVGVIVYAKWYPLLSAWFVSLLLAVKAILG